MYYICSNLVIPVTEDCKLSYAELVGPRQVNWFVSHYWGILAKYGKVDPRHPWSNFIF